MKSEQFNFNSKNSSIRGKSEKQPTVDNSRNWDRIVYLVILGAIVLGIIYYLVTGYYVIDGQGRVMANQYTVRAPDDLSIIEYYKESGDTVQKGDTLFAFDYLPEGRASGTDSLRWKEEINQREDDLFDLRQDISLKREELQSLKNQREYYREQKQIVEKEVKLNVETVNRLQEIKEQILEIEADISAIQQELQLSYRRKNRIQKSINQLSGKALQMASTASRLKQKKIYQSPYQGTVTNIFKDPLELAFESEKIVSVQRDSARILVKVLFEREDAEHLPMGDELAIRFDNGEPSRGIIIDMYAAETDLTPFFNLTGIEASEKIVAELKPVNENVRQQWRSLNGMGLTAQKTLF